MSVQTKYNFSDISEILQAIHDLFVSDEEPTEEQKKPLREAINDFFRTRTVSEMFNIYGWVDETNTLSIFDYEDWLLKPFETQMERKSVWVSKEILDVFNIVLPDWAGKESLKTRVEGIQKKLDKIVSLLEKFEIKMSVKDALNL